MNENCGMEASLKQYCFDIPKIELHAHLNGSLSWKTLNELGCFDSLITQYDLSKQPEKRNLEECFQLFRIAHDATKTAKSVYKATSDVIKDFRDDNVIYLELRTTPRAEDGMTKTDYIEAVINAIKDYCDNDNSIIVKLLLSIDRRHDVETSKQAIELIAKMKEKYPDIIKGVDLSGNPALGSFDTTLFANARKYDLKISLHCGEVKNDEEVVKMLAFKPDRIGHGTNIHPDYGGSQETWDMYLQHPIPLECCLTSNVLCGTSKSYKEHHLNEWIKQHLPFSLNTDDKGVFNTSSSEEYWHAASHFGMNAKDLWSISYKSVDHSFASDNEKDLLRDKLTCWLDKQAYV